MKTNPTWVLTIASGKIWLRDRAALFWTFFLPVLIMVIFGVLNFGAFGSVSLGLVDEAGTDASRGLAQGLASIDAIKLTKAASLDMERQALLDGDRQIVLVLPPGFGATRAPADVRVLYNEGRPEQVQVGLTIIREALNRMTLQAAGVQPLFTLSTESVTSRSFSYIDFLVPGVVAMSIMQLGLFSVAFGFVQLRQRGILRRLWATPVRPRSFLFAQVVTRLVVSVLQSLLLIGIAVVFFDVQIVGNLLGILVLAVLGGAVFLTMGFAIAGRAKNENVAAPIANIVALPMMFLSGVFFGRDAMPEALKTVTSYLPLTYLADGMRAISTQGTTLWSQWPAMLGLGVWLVVSFAVATRLFRWE